MRSEKNGACQRMMDRVNDGITLEKSREKSDSGALFTTFL